MLVTAIKVIRMSIKLSRKRKVSLRPRAEQINEARMRAKLAIPEATESTMEGPSSTDVLETDSLIEDLSDIREEYSSDDAMMRVTKSTRGC